MRNITIALFSMLIIAFCSTSCNNSNAADKKPSQLRNEAFDKTLKEIEVKSRFKKARLIRESDQFVFVRDIDTILRVGDKVIINNQKLRVIY